jgi:hypothetical protein
MADEKDTKSPKEAEIEYKLRQFGGGKPHVRLFDPRSQPAQLLTFVSHPQLVVTDLKGAPSEQPVNFTDPLTMVWGSNKCGGYLLVAEKGAIKRIGWSLGGLLSPLTPPLTF